MHEASKRSMECSHLLSSSHSSLVHYHIKWMMSGATETETEAALLNDVIEVIFGLFESSDGELHLTLGVISVGRFGLFQFKYST